MNIKKFVFFLIALDVVRCQETPQNSVCGSPKRTAGNIGDGRSIRRGDFPWMVALASTLTYPPTFICGGTLISSAHVITAAHCLRRSSPHSNSTTIDLLANDVLALFGAYNLSNPHESGRTLLFPEEIHIHDEWNISARSDADTAILKFEDDEIPLTKYIRPVCLWDFEDAPEENEGIAVGWGGSGDVVESHEKISKQVKLSLNVSSNCFSENSVSRRVFCASSTDCTSNVGNGFFIKANDLFYLKGISSAFKTNSQSCNFTAYTEVLKFRAWIDKILNGNAVQERNATVAVHSHVSCVIKNIRWSIIDKTLKTCGIENLTIATENAFIQSPPDLNIEGLSITLKRDVEFLPKNISETFPRLLSISVAYCGLKALSESSFTGLRYLKFLFLDENYIETIATDAFRDQTKLRILSLNYNQLQTLNSSVFRNLKSLTELSLTGNKLQMLFPNTFSSLTRLEKLNIDSNQLQELFDPFTKLVNLKKLSLEVNQIWRIPPELFRKNVKLEEILLSENNLAYIPNDTFARLPNCTLVDLRANGCVDAEFHRKDFNAMRNHLSRKCGINSWIY